MEGQSTPPPGWQDYEQPAPIPRPPTTGGSEPAGHGRKILLALGAATVVVLAAFAILSIGGGKSGGGGPFSPVAEAADRTAAVSGRLVGSGTVTADGMTMQMSFSGAYDGDGDRTSMRMEVTSSSAPSQALDLMNPIEAVSDGYTVYMTAPIFAGQLPDGKSWMKIDMEEIAGDQPEPTGTDVTAMLDELRAVGKVKQVGTERIRGVKTTHYRATVEPAAAAQAARDRGDEVGARVLEQNTGVSTYDVWIDGDSYIRRMSTIVPFDMVGGAGSQMTMTMDLYDFGVDPEIEVPDDGDTYDATEMATEGMESQLGLG